MKPFLTRQLALEINVSPRGSRLGVVDGSSGQILISPNTTDVGAILACNVLALPTRKLPFLLCQKLSYLKKNLVYRNENDGPHQSPDKLEIRISEIKRRGNPSKL